MSAQGNARDERALRSIANDFGLSEALLGFVVGIVLATIAVGAFAAASHHPRHPSNFGSEAASLCGLWVGLIGACVVASALRAGRRKERWSFAAFRTDYGLSLRIWPDAVVGLVAGVAAQYLLVPALESLLVPFVPNVFHRLGAPAARDTAGVHGVGLWVLGFFICIGSPVVEELFFRGLLLRGLAWRFRSLGARLCPIMSVGLTALPFGLAHFEALQLIALVGFGAVLGTLAWRSGRLGPGIVAHGAFNAVTFLALVGWH